MNREDYRSACFFVWSKRCLGFACGFLMICGGTTTVIPYNVAVSRLIADVFAIDKPYKDFRSPGHFLISLVRLIGMVGKACLPSNAYFPRTPDYIPFILCLCLPV